MASTHYGDVTSIFQQQTVSEIEMVDRKIRGEIEKRKQDLRTMVGERYRDLINAADTIQDMKCLTDEVTENIEMISDLCFNIKQKESEDTSKHNKKSSKLNEETFYSLATQMDLLVDTPEKIWSALDNHHYLHAAKLYLLSHHIVNTSLNINVSHLKRGSQRDIFASFPILHHQWAAISHFKPSILKACRSSLKDATLPDQALSRGLCSIVLLEDYSPRQVFTEFLMARKSAFRDVFHPSFHSASSKKQICDITHMLRLSIEQIVSLFYTDENEVGLKPLFYKTLQEITDDKVNKKEKVFEELFGNMDMFTVSKFLPTTVTDFVPKLRSIPVSISVSYIQKHTIEWMNGCIKEIQSGVKTLLSFINNIKGLALIRDAVYDLLDDRKNDKEMADDDIIDDEDEKRKEKEDEPSSWKGCCRITLNKSLSIWDEIFRPLFLERAKEILRKQCEVCFESSTSLLHEILDSLRDTNDPLSDTCWDHDFTSFLWREFPDNSNSGNLKDDLGMSMLALKVRSYTPSVQRWCCNFNNTLKTILHDAKYFISDQATHEQEDEMSRMKTIKKDVQRLMSTADDVFGDETSCEPFEKFADASLVREALNLVFEDGVTALCKDIGAVLEETKMALKIMKIEDIDETMALLNRATYLARLCLSIPELCDNIQTITGMDQNVQKSQLNRQLSSSTRESLKRNAKKVSSKSLEKINTEFKTQSSFAVTIWSDWTCNMCRTLVTNTLKSPDEYFVFSTTNWDSVTIVEEGEGGEKVKSTIKVPAMTSFHTTSLLCHVSEELHRIGGSIFDRPTIQKFCIDIGNAILDAYDGCLDDVKSNTTFQNKLFQMIFDIKFVCKLLAGNSDLKEKTFVDFRQRCGQFVKTLEQLVDPFDLDVFMPHIEKYVQKQIQRSHLLYGSIAQMDKHSLQSQSRVSTTNEQANVIPLVSNPPRFMLLPISTHKEPRNLNSVVFGDTHPPKHPLYAHQLQISVN